MFCSHMNAHELTPTRWTCAWRWYPCVLGQRRPNSNARIWDKHVQESACLKRQHFCKEELRLNRRLAPELYIDLLPLYGNEHNPSFSGEGTAFEYIIKMHQFDQACLLDNLLSEGKLNRDVGS